MAWPDIGSVNIGPIDPAAVGLPTTDFAHSLQLPVDLTGGGAAPAASPAVSRNRLYLAAGVAGLALVLLVSGGGRRR